VVGVGGTASVDVDDDMARVSPLEGLVVGGVGVAALDTVGVEDWRLECAGDVLLDVVWSELSSSDLKRSPPVGIYSVDVAAGPIFLALEPDPIVDIVVELS